MSSEGGRGIGGGRGGGRGVPPHLDVDRLIDDRRTRVIVCCGSGGVGKTTTAAAIGLRAAERGRNVVVLTVDPLASALKALVLMGLAAAVCTR
jgi:Mrp family chromosome partitioning ATPase